MLKKVLYVSASLFFSFACERKEVRINDESDTKYAKELAANFYKELSDLDTLKIYNYFSYLRYNLFLT